MHSARQTAGAGAIHLLLPKWLTARARARQRDPSAGARRVILSLLGAGFWVVIFALVYRLLAYFKDVQEIGPLLAGKLLGVVLLCFFSILLLSNVVTALSTFFLARDLDMIAAAPLDWLRVYWAKLFETTLHSSWMVALLAVPIFSAFGAAFGGGWFFPLIALAIFIPLMIIPATMGSAVTLLLVNIFPARRTRDILGMVAVLSAAGVVVLLRLARPEQLARPDGFRSLVEFVTVLRTPSSIFLPSEWAQQGVMAWLTFTPDPLPIYLLWTTAAAFVVFGALLHRWLYRAGFSRAQEGAQGTVVRGRAGRMTEKLLAPLGVIRRELVLKEIRLFLRDSSQWSQLILLGVLLVVYVFNIKLLPLHSGESVGFFLINVIPFLNLALAGFVLASVAARFLFPGVSMEGRTLWLLRSSPLRMRDLLWAKFWVGTLPLLVLAVAIVTLTNVMLKVSPFMFAVSLISIILLTFAMAGLAVGLGTLFPRYETESAAQIPTSFGGLVFMMAAVAVIGGVVVLEARPVYAWVRSQAYGTPADPMEMAMGFVLAALLCVTACVAPLAAAERRLSALEQ